jgi:hypothetical protein
MQYPNLNFQNNQLMNYKIKKFKYNHIDFFQFKIFFNLCS